MLMCSRAPLLRAMTAMAHAMPAVLLIRGFVSYLILSPFFPSFPIYKGTCRGLRNQRFSAQQHLHMAIKVAVFVLVSFLLVSTRVSSTTQKPSVASSPAHAPAPALAPRMIKDTKECGGACKDRCKLHSRQNVCGRACMACCSACKCVPPGTAGHTELCGKCYTEWKTHGNRTKCP